MRSRKYRFPLLVVLLLLCSISLMPANAAPSFANNLFRDLWQYSDKLVDEIPGAGRGFTWGPHASGGLQEDYQEGIGGKRQVEYFDKSRMELTPNGLIVTNGLLTKELVTGQRQDGNVKFIPFQPSTIQVAGDDNNGGGNLIAPTYASFRGVVKLTPSSYPTSDLNTPVRSVINKNGQVGYLPDNSLPAYILIGKIDEVFKVGIPQAFVDFQNLQGRVWDAGSQSYLTQKVYTNNPIANVFGYAISEAYWTSAVVAGQQKPVLVQLFERRVLTYTPSNPDGFKVEMGNIGVHYYQWRYGFGTPPTQTQPPVTTQPPPQQTPKITGGISVSNSNPTQHTWVTVYATLFVDGVPAYPANMIAVFHYKNDNNPTCTGQAESNGTASCGRNIGGAELGRTVIIDVTTTYKGQNYYGSTSFTPVGSTNPTPTPIPTNPPSTGVTFLQVTGGPPGANAYVKVQTAANASCSISYVTPIGNPSNAQGLVSKTADGTGIVDWTWKISPGTTPGTGTVTVTCNGVSASTGITIG